MQAAFGSRTPERRASAAFTIAIHAAILALLLTLRPEFPRRSSRRRRLPSIS
jgi:hypothetical protein